VTHVVLKKRPDVHIAAVVPAYNVAQELGGVLRSMPPLFTTIVVVDDASRDQTAAIAERYAQLDPRIMVVRHDENRGVGGAMVSGFRTAVDAGADIIVKVDGDGQMPMWLLPELVEPLITGHADYAKGNRFRDFTAIRAMPVARRIGNVALSFLAKAATGYWQTFDPTNGFIAIRADVLSQLPLNKIDPTYFFETSMLAHLYIIGAVVKDVPMPARYAGETSSLSIPRVLHEFPVRLIWSLLRRVVLKNFVNDFNLESLDLACGLPLLVAGVLFGAWKWIWYASHALAAPAGTVVLAALMIMLGVQLLLSAASLDLDAVPREPINGGPLLGETSAQIARSGRTDSEIDVRRTSDLGEEDSPRGAVRLRE
jgi:glycosyltransferase involved in cell wall biosynthesis